MPKKLCDWKKKHIRKRRAALEALIRDPRFLCQKCARVANDPRVLCKARRAFIERRPATKV
jgi:hypothetical protein